MIINGTITRTLPDGTKAEADFMVDTETNAVVQVGGDADITAENIDLIQTLANTPHEGDPEDVPAG